MTETTKPTEPVATETPVENTQTAAAADTTTNTDTAPKESTTTSEAQKEEAAPAPPAKDNDKPAAESDAPAASSRSPAPTPTRSNTTKRLSMVWNKAKKQFSDKKEDKKPAQSTESPAEQEEEQPATTEEQARPSTDAPVPPPKDETPQVPSSPSNDKSEKRRSRFLNGLFARAKVRATLPFHTFQMWKGARRKLRERDQPADDCFGCMISHASSGMACITCSFPPLHSAPFIVIDFNVVSLFLRALSRRMIHPLLHLLLLNKKVFPLHITFSIMLLIPFSFMHLL